MGHLAPDSRGRLFHEKEKGNPKMVVFLHMQRMQPLPEAGSWNPLSNLTITEVCELVCKPVHKCLQNSTSDLFLPLMAF